LGRNLPRICGWEGHGKSGIGFRNTGAGKPIWTGFQRQRFLITQGGKSDSPRHVRDVGSQVQILNALRRLCRLPRNEMRNEMMHEPVTMGSHPNSTSNGHDGEIDHRDGIRSSSSNPALSAHCVRAKRSLLGPRCANKPNNGRPSRADVCTAMCAVRRETCSLSRTFSEAEEFANSVRFSQAIHSRPLLRMGRPLHFWDTELAQRLRLKSRHRSSWPVRKRAGSSKGTHSELSPIALVGRCNL
jgi:hypothetical protein